MTTKKPPVETQQTTANNQDCATIFEEVATFEDLAPRMHELLLTTRRGQEFICACAIAE